MREPTSQLLREIRDDHQSGASEITEKAAKCLVTSVESFKGGTKENFMEELSRMGHAIIEAQPAMAPLFNLVNKALLETEKSATVEEGRFRVKKIAEEVVEASREGLKRIARYASTVVGRGSTVLVHSSSRTLSATLLALHHQNRDLSVICTESRPLREGIMLARRLAEARVPVRLIVDTAAFQLLEQVSLVFVGADTISPSGVINKIGTRGLAVAANYQDVPFYVLAGTDKCLVSRVRAGPEKEIKPPEEIVEDGGLMGVLNFYFDCTPLELVSAVITEKGIWNGGDLERYFRELKIHPLLTNPRTESR